VTAVTSISEKFAGQSSLRHLLVTAVTPTSEKFAGRGFMPSLDGDFLESSRDDHRFVISPVHFSFRFIAKLVSLVSP
jgi:hypothetical protein